MTDADAEEVEGGIHALAHRGRRTMLRLVRDQEHTSSELAEAAGLTRSAASQHLRILREAGLVHVRVDANRRLYRADLERLAALRSSLDDFWGDRLIDLKHTAEKSAPSRKRTTGIKLVDQSIAIDADPATVYEHFVDTEQFIRWMAPTAQIEPRPGGLIRWTHLNGDTCEGRFVELVPARRIVFTYGWDRPDVEVPQGPPPSRSRSNPPNRAPCCASSTPGSPDPWPTPTTEGGATTCSDSPPAHPVRIPDPTTWPISEYPARPNSTDRSEPSPAPPGWSGSNPAPDQVAFIPRL